MTDVLGSHPDIEVVGEAVDDAQAVACVQSLRPSVVLMDIRMPLVDGIEATRRIFEDPNNADVRDLILTTFEEDENVVSPIRAGASGFIGKGAELEDIVKAVLAVYDGDALLSPVATRALITRYVAEVPRNSSAGTPHFPELEQLTVREQEVLVLVARGFSNTDIAEHLQISPYTSKTHVNRIMDKVQAHDRAQLVVLAYESGLLTPGQQN
ncbi:response regulator transcription factor [Neomicrococcus lactis]|uniref:DNA-binding NarL/FixJ family response regulator n=1 Tax=Neomicrococcus lactis TaxID=732241 RepID=A0A7W9DCA7_9MICC|nr:DNA-binding NarL/FixJ family response regulator [Neomicrococcus lactis]